LRSPQRTDLDFNSLEYSLYIGAWLSLAKPIRDNYKISFMEMRILCALDGLVRLYGWRLQGIGITPKQIKNLTGFTIDGIAYRLNRLFGLNYITCEEERGQKRLIKRYKLTKKGKEIVNKLSGDRDKVHERIIDFLYQKKLLKQ
jgi:DNA-binding MarR family transcriptional regulator